MRPPSTAMAASLRFIRMVSVSSAGGNWAPKGWGGWL